MIHLLHLLGTIGLLVSGAATSLFCVLYHLSARWRATEVGRHLMATTFSFAAAFDYFGVRTLTTTPRLAGMLTEVIRALLLGVIAVLMVQRLWMLYRIQIRPRRGDRQ